MGDFPALTACLKCRILYKPHQVRGETCIKCGLKLSPAPAAIVRAKHRVKQKRQREKDQKKARRDPTATRKDASMRPRDSTQRVEVPHVIPVTGDDFKDKESNGATLKAPVKAVSPDELLTALESAPIPQSSESKRRKNKRRKKTTARRIKKTQKDSLFIPLDTFMGQKVQAPPRSILPMPSAPAKLFGASGYVGDSGITAQTEKARRGQIGKLQDIVHFGDYELNEVLGRGGMGVVYKATQLSLGREVALKLMSSQTIADEDRLRFQREARAAARLRHPNIVPIFDIGNHDGHDFFTLELIEGTTLHSLAMERKIDYREAMDVVRKVALAIDYAHEQGVIHRDLKPQNILIDLDGEPHVTDFGLAKDLQDAINLTTQGIALGSPPYMPPEQAMGNYDQVDAVSDVYGLGTLLYECLAARPPFVGETPYEIIARVQSEDPIDPRQLSPDISLDAQVICLKAMDKVKAGRYQSGKELADDLKRALDGEPIVARPPTFTVKLARRLVKYRFQVASMTISLAVVLAMAIFAWSVYLKGERQQPKKEIDYRRVSSNQRGSPIDQALNAAEEGRFQQAISLLAGALEGHKVDREKWLVQAQDKILSLPSRELQAYLYKAMDKARTRSAGTDLGAGLLLDALASGIAEVAEKNVADYIKASKSLVSLYMDASFPIQIPEPIKDTVLVDQIGQLAQVMQQERGQARRGDGELARALTGVLLQVLRAGFSRQRGRLESSRTLMVKVLAEETPGQAILPIARALLRLEGGRDSEGGKAFLRAFQVTFEGHPLQSIIISLKRGLPRPRIDPSSGHVRAPSSDFRGLRWRFPDCSLGSESESEQPSETNQESQQLLQTAARAGYPTNPIASVDGSQIFVGWLSFVYCLDNAMGTILQRFRVPARVHGLRSFKDGLLIATVIRSSGRVVNQPKYEDVLIDPSSGRVRRLAPGFESSGPLLVQSHKLGFEPLVRQALQCEADSWLGWSEILVKEQEIKDQDTLLWSRGKSFEDRKKLLAPFQKGLQILAKDRLKQSERFVKRDSKQPWLLLRRTRLFKYLGQLDEARKSASDVVVAVLQTRNEYLTPFEEVIIAAELEQLGFQDSVEDLLKHAFQSLLRDYHYIPAYAGFGENDPGQILTGLLDRMVTRGRRVSAKRKQALLRRYRVIEGWRDAFAPALASSSDAKRARKLAFGKSSPIPVHSPKPLLANSNERLPTGFAGIGLKSILTLDMLLFGTTKYLLFFGTFVVALTCIGVYRRQKRDLVLLGYLTWSESMMAWYKNPLLRLQHSFPSYWTIRDRLGLCLVILLFLVGLALHDTVITALDTRQRAPRPMFTGLPGHPQVLEYLHGKYSENDVETGDLLAFALAQSGEKDLAIALYAKLARQQSDPYAFNTCVLREFGRLQGPVERSALASKLDDLIEDQLPERHWARYALTREVKAQERAFQLASQRFSLIDQFGSLQPELVAPSREDRDTLVLGRSFWWTSFFQHLSGMFLSSQDADQLDSACKRVLGDGRAGTTILVSFRTRAFFLLPAALLVVLSSLLLPSRNRDPRVMLSAETRRIDFLFPGVPQFLRGYAPSGVLLGSALIFLVRYIFEGRVVKVFPFSRLAMLVGEAGSSEGAVFFRLRLVLLIALIFLFALHWLQLKRLISESSTVSVATDSKAPTLKEPINVDS
jgi:serine/threonine protein kinase